MLQGNLPRLRRALKLRARNPFGNVAQDREEIDKESSRRSGKTEVFHGISDEFDDGVVVLLNIISM